MPSAARAGCGRSAPSPRAGGPRPGKVPPPVRTCVTPSTSLRPLPNRAALKYPSSRRGKIGVSPIAERRPQAGARFQARASRALKKSIGVAANPGAFAVGPANPAIRPGAGSDSDRLDARRGPGPVVRRHRRDVAPVRAQELGQDEQRQHPGEHAPGPGPSRPRRPRRSPASRGSPARPIARPPTSARRPAGGSACAHTARSSEPGPSQAGA